MRGQQLIWAAWQHFIFFLLFFSYKSDPGLYIMAILQLWETLRVHLQRKSRLGCSEWPWPWLPKSLSFRTSIGRHLTAWWARFICSSLKLTVQMQWFGPELAHYTATRGNRKVQLQTVGRRRRHCSSCKLYHDILPWKLTLREQRWQLFLCDEPQQEMSRELSLGS